MSRVAVFIDAGYFWVQASHVVLGVRSPRANLIIDYAALHKKVLEEVAAQFPGKDLLRVFWYDGPDSSGLKGPDHQAIDLLDDFKLRMGTRNGLGQQKAVDGTIISDLLTFAQTRSIDNALLMSGDADLTPGVVSAQALGLRIHLIIIGPQASTSPYLAAEVDRKVMWEPAVVAAFAKPAATKGGIPAPAGSPSVSPSLGATDFESIALNTRANILAGPHAPLIATALTGAQPLPAIVDKTLLRGAVAHAGRMLSEAEKRQLRIAFKAIL